jgi:hypothetical protein
MLQILVRNLVILKKYQTRKSFIQTKESKIKADVFLNYKIEDFANLDKVQFDVKLYPSLFASNDIRHFMMG